MATLLALPQLMFMEQTRDKLIQGDADCLSVPLTLTNTHIIIFSGKMHRQKFKILQGWGHKESTSNFWTSTMFT